jgi:glycolate oxidase FAD binding subunit
LFVGSLGTLGVIVQVTLRTSPRPETSQWALSTASPRDLRARLFRPACLAWDGQCTRVLLEGHPDDIGSEIATAELEPAAGPPSWPAQPHRGRGSVRPAALGPVADRLDDIGCTWIAEGGVGTIHIGATTEGALAAARAALEAEAGWLLREAGAPGLDPFGVPLPNLELMTRIKSAFDPPGKLNPGRLPYARTAA